MNQRKNTWKFNILNIKTVDQNSSDAVDVVLRGIALNTYIRK